MAKSYLFYDLETSGLDPRSDRIMQFAAMRTDENFQPIGEPYNLMVILSDDTLPSPQALMVTGITPQQTVADGYSEAEFCRIFIEEICTPDTVIIGYNNIRFDDEFIRAILWRNYYDPYQWSYQEGRSRWDMLDVVRMTRALRPEGVNWPLVDGKPVNKLELLSKENGLVHTKAHDALSDVEALIAVTRLIADKQPQLFSYLFKMRDKKAVRQLVNLDQPAPFVYSSGRYEAEHQKTTVAWPLAEADNGNLYVYDLRYDPSSWLSKSESELETIINTPYHERSEDYQALPIKKLQYNRAPAVAPPGVLVESDGWQKLGLDQSVVEKHRSLLSANPQFGSTVASLLSRRPDYPTHPEAEGRIYDGFISDRDRLRSEQVRQANQQQLAALKPNFEDQRLKDIYPRYKARNFPSSLSDSERIEYEEYRRDRLTRQSQAFMESIQQLIIKRDDLTHHQQFVIEELQLWLEAVGSVDDD